MLSVSSRVTSTAPRSSSGTQLGQQPRLPQQVRRALRPEPRRDLVQQRPEHPPETGQVRLIRDVSVGVTRRELGDLGPPPGRVVRQPQVPSVPPRREVGPLRVHVVAVLVQPQVAHQVRWQQRDHVGQRRDRKVWSERMLTDSGPARYVAALAHDGIQPGAGQVRRRDQPVVPAADHHDIRVSRHRQPFPFADRRSRLPSAMAGTAFIVLSRTNGARTSGPHGHRRRPAGHRHRRAGRQPQGRRRRGGRGRRRPGRARGPARTVRFRLRVRRRCRPGPRRGRRARLARGRQLLPCASGRPWPPSTDW